MKHLTSLIILCIITSVSVMAQNFGGTLNISNNCPGSIGSVKTSLQIQISGNSVVVINGSERATGTLSKGRFTAVHTGNMGGIRTEATYKGLLSEGQITGKLSGSLSTGCKMWGAFSCKAGVTSSDIAGVTSKDICEDLKKQAILLGKQILNAQKAGTTTSNMRARAIQVRLNKLQGKLIENGCIK